MRKASVFATGALGVLILAGCSDPTLEERVEYRDECEAAGGEYTEWEGLFGGDFHADCDLSSEGRE